MASVEYPDKEEHYLLRIHDSRAADRLREILRRPPGETISDLELKFDSEGTLHLHALPLLKPQMLLQHCNYLVFGPIAHPSKQQLNTNRAQPNDCFAP